MIMENVPKELKRARLGRRGVRNNNPGNIRHNQHNEWYGQIGVDEDGFCIFEFAWQGYRAILKILITYQRLRLAEDGSAIDTIAEIIQRWAPIDDNPDQPFYIQFLRRKLVVEKGQHVDVEDAETAGKLLDGIGHFECGIEKPFGRMTGDHIRRGIRECQVKSKRPPEKDDMSLKSTKGAVVAGAAAVAAPAALPAVADFVSGAAPVLPFFSQIIELAPWVIGAAAFALLGYAVYRMIRSHWYGV